MEPTPITSALLQPVTNKSVVEELFELTKEEASLRFTITKILVQPTTTKGRGWRREEKVERAWGEAEMALQELRTRQLHRLWRGGATGCERT